MDGRRTGEVMRVSVVSNAGLFIESKKHKILTDALTDKMPMGFSPIPAERREEILSGCAPYDNVTECLVSHYHKDHYDDATMKRYLASFHPTLYLPDAYKKAERYPKGIALEKIPLTHGIKKRYSLEKSGEVKKNGAPDETRDSIDYLDVFSISHSGREYRAMDVLVYHLHLDGKDLLLLSDADFDADYIGWMAGGIEYDAIIMNPLFLDIPTGREAVFQRLSAKNVVICHLPFKEDDTYGLYDMAITNMKEHGPFPCPVTLFRDRDSSILL